ncbi:MAG TPA: MBL fold metallo-hydrolase [Anaerolineae bacterium]|nr:MBL fold metallo-hydrolase [Anaerolineae bacterium]
MQRERIAEDIYVFTSDLYLEVTAGAVITDQGAVVIDTLPFPQETRRMRDFVHSVSPAGIRFVLLTHSHGDHSYGSYLFPEAELVAHLRCWELLQTVGVRSLREAQRDNPDLSEVQIRLPPMIFEESLTLRMGEKTIIATHSPGHTDGLSTVYVKEDRVLFASDTVMPVPYIVEGKPEALAESLAALRKLPTEGIVQGHGRVLLRGEVQEALDSSIDYLRIIDRIARDKAESAAPRRELLAIDIEDCGKSRIPLDGLVQRLHQANLLYLYDMYRAELGKANQDPSPAGQ